MAGTRAENTNPSAHGKCLARGFSLGPNVAILPFTIAILVSSSSSSRRGNSLSRRFHKNVTYRSVYATGRIDTSRCEDFVARENALLNELGWNRRKKRCGARVLWRRIERRFVTFCNHTRKLQQLVVVVMQHGISRKKSESPLNDGLFTTSWRENLNTKMYEANNSFLMRNDKSPPLWHSWLFACSGMAKRTVVKVRYEHTASLTVVLKRSKLTVDF